MESGYYSDAFLKFENAWNKLAREKRPRDVYEAVYFWCYELSFDAEKSDLVVENLQDFLEDHQTVRYALNIYRDISESEEFVFKLSLRLTPSEIRFQERVKKLMSRLQRDMELKTIFLIAFVLTGIGLVIYLMNQKEQQDSREPIISRSPTSSSPVSTHVLLLVIDADSGQELVQSLRSSRKITSETVSSLSSISLIQGLWQGSQSNYHSILKAKDCFSRAEKPKSEYSEYDIYLIEVTLAEPQPEFQKGSNSMSWCDAFKRLSQQPNKHDVKVSNRLSSTVTDDFDSQLYR